MTEMTENNNDSDSKKEEIPLSSSEIEAYEFLVENDVRYSIVSCISIFKEPLNLSKLSKLTGHPITTLIHHIPQMIEHELIKVEKISGKRGKFYYTTERFFKIRKAKSSLLEIEELNTKLDELTDLTTKDYKVKYFNEMKRKYEANEFTDNIADTIRSQGVFNNNITKISANYIKYVIKLFSEENPQIQSISLADIDVGSMSLSFSNVNQYLEFQKIYLNFNIQLFKLRNKLEEENAQFNDKDLEKAYIYFFTTPIVDISELV